MKSAMTHAELLAAVEAGGQALLDNGLLVNNFGFVLAATPDGLAAFKIVNAEEDNAKLRVALASVLRDFARQVETGQVRINVRKRS